MTAVWGRTIFRPTRGTAVGTRLHCSAQVGRLTRLLAYHRRRLPRCGNSTKGQSTRVPVNEYMRDGCEEVRATITTQRLSWRRRRARVPGHIGYLATTTTG